MGKYKFLIKAECDDCRYAADVWLATGGILPSDQCPEHGYPKRIILEDTVEGQTLLNGTKKDEGKARWDLLPYEVIDSVAIILTNGAKKYADRNWEKGISYGRVFAGVMRHLMEFWVCKMFGRDGINHADGKQPHVDHAITGLMFLSAYEKRGLTQFDDRPVKS